MTVPHDDQQPGAMPAPQPAPQPGEPVPPQQSKAKSTAKRVARAVAVPVVLIGGFAIYNEVTSAAGTEVGECLAGTASATNADLSKVDCGSAEAKFKVTARFTDKPESVFDDDAAVEKLCTPAGKWDSAYREGEPGSDGTILCLLSV